MKHLYPETTGKQEEIYSIILMLTDFFFFFVRKHKKCRWQPSLLCCDLLSWTSKQLGWVYTVSTDCLGGTCRINRTGRNRRFVEQSQTCEAMQLLGWARRGLSGPCLEEENILTRTKAAPLLLFCLLMGSLEVFVHSENDGAFGQCSLNHHTKHELKQYNETAVLKSHNEEVRMDHTYF